MVKPTGKKPERPEGCPLFPHAGGTWAKKIDGRHEHFGPWHDLKGALREYNRFVGAATYQPGPVVIPKGQNPLLELLHDAYLTHQHDRAHRGEITLRSFRDIKTAVGAFCDAAGWDTRFSQLTPEHFATFAKSIGRFGAHAYNRTLTLVKQMFLWGVKAQVIPHAPPYGAAFEKVPERVKRRQAMERDARTGGRTFIPEEIRALLDRARPNLKAMILLGVNCGFGNTDVAQLPMNALDLDNGVIAYARPKTGVPRRATLWPETVAALREYLKVRPKKPAPGNEHYVFLTHFGQPFVREAGDVRGGVIQDVGVVDSVGLLFRRLVDTLDPVSEATGTRGGTLGRKGRGFYALRHTFRTWAEETGLLHPTLRIMGHPLPGMSSKYVHHIPDSQLQQVTDHVRGKLFPAARAARPKRIRRKPAGRGEGGGESAS